MFFDIAIVEHAIPLLVGGAWMTLLLVAISLAIGIVIGGLVCAATLRERGLLYRLSMLYIGVFRALPETVLIFWLFYCLPIVLNSRPSAMQSAVTALSIPAGAFMAEIFRAGIKAVPKGQVEAGSAIGLSRFSIFRDVVAPQAARTVITPLLGLVTIMIKNSALVSIIGIDELFYRATVAAGQSMHYIEMLTAAAIIYFIMILPLSLLVQLRERGFARTN